MIIKSIEFQNFRQFKKGKFVFSTDPEKKITVIIGDNTFGKTTIVRAFLWCLFQENSFEDRVILNSDAQDSLIYDVNRPNVEKASVTIEMDHNDVSYKITTSELFRCGNDGKIKSDKPVTRILRVDSDGANPVPQDKVNAEIAKILSPDLKDFFFYDGENNKIENITNSKRSNLKNAVSKMVGIERIEILKSYYDEKSSVSVISKLKDKLVTVDPNLSSNLKMAIEELQKKIATANEDLESAKRSKADLQDQYDEKEQEIDANKDVIPLQNKKRDIERGLQECRNKRLSLFDTMINGINSGNALLKSLFSYNYKNNNINDEITSTSFNSEHSFKHISEKAIDQFIEMGYCVCGTKIEKGSIAYNTLLANKEHMEPHDYGKYASDFSDAEENNTQYTVGMIENMKKSSENVLDNIEAIDNLKDSLKEVVEQLEGRLDVGELQREASAIQRQIDNQEGTINYIINKELPSYTKELEDKQYKYDNLTDKSSENEFVYKCIDYAKNIYRLADNRITTSQKEAREKLETTVDSIFQQMYSNPGFRKITIDENFVSQCVLVSGKKQDKSTGLKTVQNYAFVAGLMQLIKNKLINDDFADENSDENYPLVMDAPFSATDETHITNICKVLPLYCNQIIIAVMQKDFGNAIDKISGQIGKQYRIIKNTESDSTIVEVE